MQRGEKRDLMQFDSNVWKTPRNQFWNRDSPNDLSLQSCLTLNWSLIYRTSRNSCIIRDTSHLVLYWFDDIEYFYSRANSSVKMVNWWNVQTSIAFLEVRRGSCDLLPSNYLELVFVSHVIEEENRCFAGLIIFKISVAMATIFMSQSNLKRLAFKIFEVLQVTFMVDSPRLENVLFVKVEKMLNQG